MSRRPDRGARVESKIESPLMHHSRPPDTASLIVVTPRNGEGELASHASVDFQLPRTVFEARAPPLAGRLRTPPTFVERFRNFAAGRFRHPKFFFPARAKLHAGRGIQVTIPTARREIEMGAQPHSVAAPEWQGAERHR